MPAPSANAAEIEEQPSTSSTGPELELVRRILARHHPEADPIEVYARAVELSWHDARNARYQGGYARTVTGALLKELGSVFGLAGPIVVYLLQPIPGIPPWSRYALGVFSWSAR